MKRLIATFIYIYMSIVFGVFAFGTPEESKNPNNWQIDQGADQIPGIDVAKVVGNIVVAGSSTVYPIVETLADLFREDGYTGRITVESIGSGAGFERWTKGETDISNASRPIKESETKQAQAIGRDPLEFLVGIDALVVVVNSKNTWVTDVSLATLATIFRSEKWSDVNPAWPDEAIEKFSPGTDSGTFDFFVEAVFDHKKELLLQTSSLQLSEDDNILSRGVQSSTYGIGYFGFAYYQESEDTLKALSIENQEATENNVYENLYPLARPLFMYSSKNIMIEKPQIAAFLAYTLQTVNYIIQEVGYFPISSQKENKKNTELWLNAVRGSY